MSILANVTHSSTPIGIRAVLAGNEKVGKTTLACSAPRPLLIPLETGYGGVTVNKTPQLGTYPEIESLFAEINEALQQGQFPYQTLIFDSGTALERLIHDHTLALDPKRKHDTTMESAHGGFGKAYSFANGVFDGFLKWCDYFATTYGINIIITCHVFAAKVVDPQSGEYDSWDLLLHSPKNQKTYGKREMITQWADLIGYLHEPMLVSKTENGMSMGISKNEGRVMAVQRNPAYVAGNRYGLQEPIKIPEENGWNTVAQAIHDSKGLDFFNKDV